eukprot:scaffold5988_cov381-Prasinococcus_capsulatus_cf.AAC.17
MSWWGTCRRSCTFVVVPGLSPPCLLNSNASPPSWGFRPNFCSQFTSCFRCTDGSKMCSFHAASRLLFFGLESPLLPRNILPLRVLASPLPHQYPPPLEQSSAALEDPVLVSVSIIGLRVLVGDQLAPPVHFANSRPSRLVTSDATDLCVMIRPTPDPANRKGASMGSIASASLSGQSLEGWVCLDKSRGPVRCHTLGSEVAQGSQVSASPNNDVRRQRPTSAPALRWSERAVDSIVAHLYERAARVRPAWTIAANRCRPPQAASRPRPRSTSAPLLRGSGAAPSPRLRLSMRPRSSSLRPPRQALAPPPPGSPGIAPPRRRRRPIDPAGG